MQCPSSFSPIGFLGGAYWYLYCKDPVLSFTDPAAKPCVTYYYYVNYVIEGPLFQISPGGKSNLMLLGTPYSNAVQIVTQGVKAP